MDRIKVRGRDVLGILSAEVDPAVLRQVQEGALNDAFFGPRALLERCGGITDPLKRWEAFHSTLEAAFIDAHRRIAALSEGDRKGLQKIYSQYQQWYGGFERHVHSGFCCSAGNHGQLSWIADPLLGSMDTGHLFDFTRTALDIVLADLRDEKSEWSNTLKRVTDLTALEAMPLVSGGQGYLTYHGRHTLAGQITDWLQRNSGEGSWVGGKWVLKAPKEVQTDGTSLNCGAVANRDDFVWPPDPSRPCLASALRMLGWKMEVNDATDNKVQVGVDFGRWTYDPTSVGALNMGGVAGAGVMAAMIGGATLFSALAPFVA